MLGLLRSIPEAEVVDLNAGCCGMAGCSAMSRTTTRFRGWLANNAYSPRFARRGWRPSLLLPVSRTGSKSSISPVARPFIRRYSCDRAFRETELARSAVIDESVADRTPAKCRRVALCRKWACARFPAREPGGGDGATDWCDRGRRPGRGRASGPASRAVQLPEGASAVTPIRRSLRHCRPPKCCELPSVLRF